jgi:hypothetical protein
MVVSGLGAVLFGMLLGWLAYWILRLRAGVFVLSELLTLLGVLGGAAVLSLFKSDVLFGWYAIGLVVGFGAYFVIGLLVYGKQELQPWRVAQRPPPSEPPAKPPAAAAEETP